MKTVVPFACAALLALPATVAFSAPEKEPGLYLGANYGYLKVKDDEFEDDQDSYQIILGGDFNPYFGIEGSFIDFGNYGGNLAKADTDGFTLAAKFSLPLTDFISLHARGGQLWWNTDYSVLGFKNSADGEELFWGLGASFYLTDNFAITLDYNRYNVEFTDDEVGLLAADSLRADTDLDQAAAGIQFTF